MLKYYVKTTEAVKRLRDGPGRRGVIRVHYCRGLHHRRSGCCVRYWCWWCNRDGADWRDHRYHRRFHRGRGNTEQSRLGGVE